MRRITITLAFIYLYGVLLPGMSGAADNPPFSVSDAPWRTDFSRHTVPLDEIMSGGPPRDGIPSIDEPAFVASAEADVWLGEREPVIAVSHGRGGEGVPAANSHLARDRQRHGRR